MKQVQEEKTITMWRPLGKCVTMGPLRKEPLLRAKA